MATLKSIKRRISAVGNTKKLTRAMKMIAAARLKKAQTRVLEARLFNGELNRLLMEIVKKGAKASHPLFGKSNIASTDLIVFTSDRGLCGAFNEGLLKRVASFIQDKSNLEHSVQCIVFGRKGRDYLKSRKYNIIRERVHLPSSEVNKTLDEEVDILTERFLEGKIGSAVIAFNRFKLSGGQDASFVNLLPVAPPDIVQEYCIDYLYEPTTDEIVKWVVDNIVKSNLFQAHLESSASELASRMLAMDMATRNAEDLINALTMKYNRERQSSITKELIDIVGGAEALK